MLQKELWERQGGAKQHSKLVQRQATLGVLWEEGLSLVVALLGPQERLLVLPLEPSDMVLAKDSRQLWAWLSQMTGTTSVQERHSAILVGPWFTTEGASPVTRPTVRIASKSTRGPAGD